VGSPDAGVPIGTALDGCWVKVRRGDLSLAAPGETGELYIGGVGVARGYLGRPGATADRFLPDPDGPPGSRMYATGDLGRLRPDGLLEFRGRLDDQGKIRGFRVEAGEVERAIAQHPDVAENAVLVAGQGDDRYLTLFVVPVSTLSPAQVRAYASEVLPEHMVPSAILIVDSIPVNEHGKRDREQLAAWLDEHRLREDKYVEAGTDAERYVAKLWGELLAVERVGAADDFFELGGHSLLAFRVQRRIRRDLGIDLELAEVLNNSGLRDLARLIAARQGVPA
jgi:acyl-coenzyme A synthetase/AMP-(fatty) acid ligase